MSSGMQPIGNRHGGLIYAAFVMTYHRPAILWQTIRKLSEQTCPPKLILVVDNANSQEAHSVALSFPSHNIEYVGLPENSGPAGAAHYGLKYLINRGYNWIYWGDDDDPPRHADTIERLLNIIAANRDEKIGAVGEVGQRFDWRKGVIARLRDEELHGWVKVDVIAGGSQLLVNVTAVGEVGLPKREMFFGYEEPELCLRLRQAGYQLYIDGERMREARIAAGRFGLLVQTSSTDRAIGSLWRNYYSARNYIYMMRSSFDRGDLAFKQAVKELIKSILSFRHGFSYGLTFTRMSLLGVMHGYRGAMGRTVEPRMKI